MARAHCLIEQIARISVVGIFPYSTVLEWRREIPTQPRNSLLPARSERHIHRASAGIRRKFLTQPANSIAALGRCDSGCIALEGILDCFFTAGSVPFGVGHVSHRIGFTVRRYLGCINKAGVVKKTFRGKVSIKQWARKVHTIDWKKWSVTCWDSQQITRGVLEGFRSPCRVSAVQCL